MEEYFNSHNVINITLSSEELSNKSILCPYVPKDTSLHLILSGLGDMKNKSRVKFDIILYNQIPQTVPKFITNIIISDSSPENVIMKYNVHDIGDGELVLFLKQSINIYKNDNKYTVLNKVDKHPILNNISDVPPEQLIMEIKKRQNDKMFYEISNDYYSEYVDISFNIETDTTHDTRRKLNITQLDKMNSEDFDTFVLNLYKDGALEEDTSGNENDNDDDNELSVPVTDIIYRNLEIDPTVNYTLKVLGRRTINTSNNTIDIVIPTHSKRITEIMIKTDTSISTTYLLDNITLINESEIKANQLQPKELLNGTCHQFYIISPYDEESVTITINTIFYANIFNSIKVKEYSYN